MEVTSNNLYRLALFIIFIIAVIQIINIYNKPNVIETNYDHFASMPNDKPNVNFYIKDDDRYSVDKRYNPKLIDPLITDTRLPCAPKVDWSTYQNPGANNTYDDMIWNGTSPRMVLQDSCLHCKNYKPTSSYNEPTGIVSSLTSEFEGSLHEL